MSKIVYNIKDKKDAIDLIEFWQDNVRYKYWDMVLVTNDYPCYLHDINSIEVYDVDKIIIKCKNVLISNFEHEDFNNIIIERYIWNIYWHDFIHYHKINEIVFFDSYIYRFIDEVSDIHTRYNSKIECEVTYNDIENRIKSYSFKIEGYLAQMNDLNLILTFDDTNIIIDEDLQTLNKAVTLDQGNTWYKLVRLTPRYIDDNQIKTNRRRHNMISTGLAKSGIQN